MLPVAQFPQFASRRAVEYLAGPPGPYSAGTSTDDTLLLGFGFEHLATDAQRTDLMRRALNRLLE